MIQHSNSMQNDA